MGRVDIPGMHSNLEKALNGGFELTISVPFALRMEIDPAYEAHWKNRHENSKSVNIEGQVRRKVWESVAIFESQPGPFIIRELLNSAKTATHIDLYGDEDSQTMDFGRFRDETDDEMRLRIWDEQNPPPNIGLNYKVDNL